MIIPPRIAQGFRSVPKELVDLCRPERWEQLTTPVRHGMRPIRDILVHMMGTEAFWLRHVARAEPFTRPDPASFADLDTILAAWTPQREATMSWLAGLAPAELVSRREWKVLEATQIASLEEIIWHVVTHEQYHRGQIFTRLSLLGRRDLPDYDLIH